MVNELSEIILKRNLELFSVTGSKIKLPKGSKCFCYIRILENNKKVYFALKWHNKILHYYCNSEKPEVISLKKSEVKIIECLIKLEQNFSGCPES